MLLSAKPERIEEAVLRLKEQQGKIREHLNRMQAAYLEQKLMEIGEDAEQVCIFEEDLDGVAVRNFVNGAMERCKGICGAFVGNDEKGYHYILGSKHMDVRGIRRRKSRDGAGGFVWTERGNTDVAIRERVNGIIKIPAHDQRPRHAGR